MVDLALLVCAVIAATVPGFVALREQRKLLRQIRKLAALYPPYQSADTDLDTADQSKVELAEMWDDDKEGRS